MDNFEALLSKGYFPIQLPPGFSSTSFAEKLPKFKKVWDGTKQIPTLSEKYSVARSSYFRRTTAIVNPIGFYFIAKEICDHWPKLELHYKKTTLSKSIPKFGASVRAIELAKFNELYEQKITAAAGYKYALITDISSFFPTIYTHTIPWALHTKAVAKVTKELTGKFFGNILDSKCMRLQDGQTIGLPIGPDTSHILAEIIGVAIDEKLKEAFAGWPQGFRYVDDFFLFFNRKDEAEEGLAAVTKAVSSFELQLNPAKTRIIEVKDLVEESWKYGVKRLSVSSARRQQRDDIHHYFETLFSLEKRYKDESLVKYGLKQLSSTIVKKSNWDVLEAYLLKCGYGFPNSIQVIAHILATYHHHGYPLNIQAIARFITNVIRSAASSDHHGEVSWLLWICKELAIKLDNAAAQEVEKMASPVCTLILLDMQNSDLVDLKLDKSQLSQFAVESALNGSDWLLAYEGGRRKWLNNKNISFIKAHPFFSRLSAAGVAFYDEKKKLVPIFDFKNQLFSEGAFDFDTDISIEEEFEFDEMDEEYFDSAKASEKSVSPSIEF